MSQEAIKTDSAHFLVFSTVVVDDDDGKLDLRAVCFMLFYVC